jgi:hypothetical protein
MTIKNFFIFAERCSGTHFLEQAFFENFHIDYLSKNHVRRHFFGHEDDVYTEDEIETTLFVCLVREPVEWVDSVFRSQYHVPVENGKNIDNFLNNEWYSVYDPIYDINEIPEDRHLITKERYKNIFEMRRVKQDYLLNKLKHRVKHSIIIRYEDLRDDYKNTLDFIRYRYLLDVKSSDYKPIIKYKGRQDALYCKKDVSLSVDAINLIKRSIDVNQERFLGYNI